MPRKIRSPFAAFIQWCQGPDDSKKQTYLSAAALVVGVLALIVAILALIAPVISAWTTSPEENLAKLGYRKTPDDFRRAIINKHLEAAALFAKAKMRLGPGDFQRLFDDRVFDPEIVAALLDGKALDRRDCPTDVDGIKLYGAVASHPEKATILRRICASPEVRSQIGATRTAESRRLAEADERAARQPELLRNCARKYQSENRARLLDEAANFDMLAPSTYSERQCVLAGVKAAAVMGLVSTAAVDRLISQSVASCCLDYNAVPARDDSHLREAEDALKLLGGA